MGPDDTFPTILHDIVVALIKIPFSDPNVEPFPPYTFPVTVIVSFVLPLIALFLAPVPPSKFPTTLIVAPFADAIPMFSELLVLGDVFVPANISPVRLIVAPVANIIALQSCLFTRVISAPFMFPT